MDEAEGMDDIKETAPSRNSRTEAGAETAGAHTDTQGFKPAVRRGTGNKLPPPTKKLMPAGKGNSHLPPMASYLVY